MSFEAIVHSDNVVSYLAEQYKESTNLINYIKVLLSPFDELEEVFIDILNLRMFDDATTDVLDIWGVLVGQDRLAYDANDVPFFGLDDVDVNNPVYHEGLGDTEDSSVGGIFRSSDQSIASLVKLTNEGYRPILKAKHKTNNFGGGTEELIEAVETLLDITEAGSFQISENFDTDTDPYVQIEFFIELTSLQKDYLETMDILPQLGGIRYEYVFMT